MDFNEGNRQGVLRGGYASALLILEEAHFVMNRVERMVGNSFPSCLDLAKYRGAV
jgi:hypothetical protein